MQGRRAAVIGSGVAGLAVAIRLAVQGFDVHVFEKNAFPGGKIASVEGNGFRFDGGPSLFVQPENIVDLYALCNESPADRFEFQALEIACRYFFDTGISVDAFSNRNRFAEELKQKLNEDPARVSKYLDQSAALYNTLGASFINHPIHQFSTWLQGSMWSGITEVRPALLFQSMNSYNEGRFTNPATVQIFNRFATYNGSDPYRAPAMLSMIPHLEHNLGSYFPKGGIIRIANALFDLAGRQGVNFHFGHSVEKILSRNGKAEGILVEGEDFKCDVVVSNVDVHNTYKYLLNDTLVSERLRKQEPSSSAAVFYWGMNRKYEQLSIHNIFFSGDYRQEFKKLFTESDFCEDPTIYVNISSKLQNSDAPTGKENWFVMVNAPVNRAQNWQQKMEWLREVILRKLERSIGGEVGLNIEFESRLDPSGIEENTGSFMGSLYGMSSNSFFSAFRRHPNFSRKVKGLYFCGGTVHPGGGIPLCLKSAEIVAGLVEKDFQKQK